MMTVYKALYEKMSDDLKDAEIWIDWACHLKKESEAQPLVAYLVSSAKTRVETDFPASFKMFTELCKDKEHECLCNTVAEHLEDWQESLARRIQKWG